MKIDWPEELRNTQAYAEKINRPLGAVCQPLPKLIEDGKYNNGQDWKD